MAASLPFPYISAKEIKRILTDEECYLLMEKVLKRFSDLRNGGIVQPVRNFLKVSDNGFFGLMPAYSENDAALAVKLVTVFPKLISSPVIKGIVVLFNDVNGSLQCIMDGIEITAIRTAACTAVATKYLAKPSSSILSILGAGIQAKSHWKALNLLYKFTEVRIWNRTFEKAKQLAEEIGPLASSHESAEDAVKNADIICTVTGSTTAILKGLWVKDGAHVNVIGAHNPEHREVDDAMMHSSVIYVDSREGSLAEAGDIIQTKSEIYAEIGEVIGGSKIAFIEKTTLFKNNGIAAEDSVCAKFIFDKYSAQNETLTNKL